MNRKLLKENAKIALKQNFWLVMLVVLVAQFLGVSDVGATAGGGSGYSGSTSSYNRNNQDSDDSGDDWGSTYDSYGVQQMSYEDYFSDFSASKIPEAFTTALAAGTIAIVVVICVVVIVISIAISAFLTNPIQVGYRRFFMLNRLGKGRFVDLFSAFAPNYLNVVKGMFTTSLIIFGWTMLFIIPGIIASYRYFFVPFLLAENPTMSGTRAREISAQMTDGYKFKIFVLGLSFIGWQILAFILAIPAALLTCCFMGIGAMFVYCPLGGYVSATYAELYEERREYAMCVNIANNTELVGFETQE